MVWTAPHPAISGTEAGMENDSTVYVGLDVHKESITVAYAIGPGEVELLGKTGTTKTDIDRLCIRLRSKARDVHIVDEAGPCGYSTNYLIDLHAGIIVDVEATPANRSHEVESTRTMIDRVWLSSDACLDDRREGNCTTCSGLEQNDAQGQCIVQQRVPMG
jgi:hypothetical protein